MTVTFSQNLLVSDSSAHSKN